MIFSYLLLQFPIVVIPRFEELYKEGQSGTAKLTEYTRYLTIGLGLLQSSTIVATAAAGRLFGNCSVPIIPHTSVGGDGGPHPGARTVVFLNSGFRASLKQTA